MVWGDKKYILPSLLPEFANAVDLIYIDPPFDTGADFSYQVEVPDHEVEASFTKLPSVIEQKAYRDTWGEASTHLDSYLRWFYETLLFLEKLLKPTGSIYVHLDWRVAHYAKAILDEAFYLARWVVRRRVCLGVGRCALYYTHQIQSQQVMDDQIRKRGSVATSGDSTMELFM